MKEVLLVLPGWSRSQESYEQLVKNKKTNWQVLVVDYVALMSEGIDLFSQKLLRYLQSHDLESVNLMGHSLGGALAIEFCYRYPQHVKTLFLVDSEGVYSAEPAIQVLLKIIWHIIMPDSYHDRTWHQTIISLRNLLTHPILYARLGYYAHHADLLNIAQRLSVPTVILWGQSDRVVALEQGQQLHRMIEGSRLIVLSECGHDWILSSPHLFWQHVED